MRISIIRVLPCVMVALLIVVGPAMGATPANGPAPVVHHEATITFDVPAHQMKIVDTVSTDSAFPDSVTINGRLLVHTVSYPLGNGAWCEIKGALAALPPDTLLPPRTMAWSRWLGGEEVGSPQATIEGFATLLESTKDVVFTRENVGREIEATISDEGIYLASGAAWLPTFKGALVTSRLTIDTPVGVESLTNGVRVSREVKGDRLVTVWEEKNPTDGIALIAGRYTVTEEKAGDVAISTWLLQDDPKLAATYLERTRAYLAMYDTLIGPYPFGKFATVENWFPTGYGMPSWTLLGGAVMRLPFIPYTSFGHEVCHNWWGNSVFVADEGGNWCEGLTSYCADYHYKELESPAAAREYRRNLLKDYAAYVRHPDRDTPLTEFRERHSGATRAIGYGKAMMVFHMADRAIGRAAFETALRDVYAAKRFQSASWDDFFAALARASGRDFAGFAQQWLTRTGAPILTLVKAEAKGGQVSVSLNQGAPPYELEVPIVVTTANGPVEKVVRFAKMDDTFAIDAPGATEVAVDPDCHLFRRLHPQEIEPTVSQVLGEAVPLIVLPATDGPQLAAAEAFAKAFTESDTPMTMRGGLPPTDVAPGSGTAKVLINPQPEALAARLGGPLQGRLTVTGDLVFVAGQRVSLKDNDLVFAVSDPLDPAVTDLVILCRAPERLPGLAGRIGHYGKYSYLVFPAARGETVKGNWPVAGSPLAARLERRP